MTTEAERRSLEWILRRVAKLSPEGKRWLAARVGADYIRGTHNDGGADHADTAQHDGTIDGDA